MGDNKMSDRAQRVLDALMDFDTMDIGTNKKYSYPFKSLHDFVMNIDSFKVSEDYEKLTAEEERQVIEAFLEFAY